MLSGGMLKGRVYGVAYGVILQVAFCKYTNYCVVTIKNHNILQ